MFLVMILVTSCSSPFSLSRLDGAASAAADAVLVSLYSRAVLDMKVSEGGRKRSFNHEEYIGTSISNPDGGRRCLECGCDNEPGERLTKSNESIRLPYGIYL